MRATTLLVVTSVSVAAPSPLATTHDARVRGGHHGERGEDGRETDASRRIEGIEGSQPGVTAQRLRVSVRHSYRSRTCGQDSGSWPQTTRALGVSSR